VTGFLEPDVLVELGPRRFPSVISRLLLHLGFDDAWVVDGAGDGGADVVGERNGLRTVIQCKWKQDPGRAVPAAAVAEIARARKGYDADRAWVVTNAKFGASAVQKAGEFPFPVELVDGRRLAEWWDDAMFAAAIKRPDLYTYQSEALAAVTARIRASNRALVVMATGLGKTVVMGAFVSSFLIERPGARILVIAPTKALVEQLEKALWPFLDRSVETHCLTEGHHPDSIEGVACATIQAAQAYVQEGYSPDLVIIDEAHHIGGQNNLGTLLHDLSDTPQLGLTATPWRGDGYKLEEWFAVLAFTLSITDGMKLGYLADVDYRLFIDTIPWDEVRQQSGQSYSVRDLNTKLFLPQRDEKIRDELISIWNRTPSPRAIVFCQTISHAERMVRLLNRVPQFREVAIIHGELGLRERQQALLKFRKGVVRLIVAVDVLNEGIDVPDVNIVCFARVTHSRRIFVQQLGRGLRIAPGKGVVEVLDFVSDVRRVAAALAVRRELIGESEELYLAGNHRIEFVDQEVGDLMNEWIKDAAEIEDDDGGATLEFPGLDL